MFQIYILYERHWILSEKQDDLIYNEHEVVDIFADKILIINTKNETTTNELYISSDDSLNILLFHLQNSKNIQFTYSKSINTYHLNSTITDNTFDHNVPRKK